MTAPTIHVHPGHQSRLFDRMISSAVSMLMVAEVRYRTLRFMAAIGGRTRPDRLERHQDEEEDEDPAAHSWADSMPAVRGMVRLQSPAGLHRRNVAACRR